jgi:hypothetical protein
VVGIELLEHLVHMLSHGLGDCAAHLSEFVAASIQQEWKGRDKPATAHIGGATLEPPRIPQAAIARNAAET